jgi:hypothetical protein
MLSLTICDNALHCSSGTLANLTFVAKKNS